MVGQFPLCHAFLLVVILKFQAYQFSQIFQGLQETNVDISKIPRTCTAQKMRFFQKVFFLHCSLERPPVFL